MKIALTKDQVAARHGSRIEQDFSRLFLAAGSPPGVALFGVAREDGGEDLCLSPPAVRITRKLLKANGGVPTAPPVDEGNVLLLVGHSADTRLLSS